MEGYLKQSTAVDVTILVIDSSDHITGKTGLAAGLTIYASKAAGTPAVITPTITELDATNVKGVYKLAFTTTHSNTLGELQLHVTGAGMDPADFKWQVATYLPGEAATLQADQAVNTTKVGGTTQTARDLGASVLLSTGTGTGQLDFTSGVVKANLAQILGTALTETAGQIAAAFKKFFNIAAPAATMDHLVLVDTTTAATTLETRLTGARAGYLDNLNIGGAVAGSSEVTGLNVNTRSNLLVPEQIETPDSGTLVYKVRLHLYDEVGNMEAPDSTPTVTLTNAAGTDRSSRLSAASNPSTGVYTWDYTATAGDAEEQLVWLFTVVEGGVTRTYPATSFVVEETAYRFTATDRTNLGAIKGKTDQFVFTNTNKVDAAFNAAGDFPQACADKAWSTTTRALTDKAGFSLSSGGIQAIWDALTSALTTAGSIGKWIVDKLDVVLSTRLATTGYTAPLSAGATANAVWNEAISGHLTAGTTGNALNAAGAAGDPWATALPGAYGSGSAGNIIGNRLDVVVSTRTKPADTQAAVTTVINDVGITQAAADKVWGTTVRTLSSFGTLVADVATAVWGAAVRVLTAGTNIVLAKGAGVTGFNDPTAATTATAVRTELATELARLDVNTSTRLASGSYVAPDNAGIGVAAAAAVSAATDASTLVGRLTSTRATKLDNLDAAITTRAAAGDAMALTAGERGAVADKVLARDLAGGADAAPGGRSVRNALRSGRNRKRIAGGIMYVYEEDDATIAWQGPVTTAPGDPLVEIDPA